VTGVDTWNQFVAHALRDAVALDEGIGGLAPDASALDRGRLGGLARLGFRLGMASLLVGAEDVARLALAVERALDLLAAGDIDPGLGLPILASSSLTLRRACEQLASPDRSGARVEGLPLEGARYELETLFPVPSTGKRPTIAEPAIDVPATALVRRPAAAATPTTTSTTTSTSTSTSTSAFVWTPAVDDDMVELFFDEAAERIEAISGKLLEMERRPGDAELLRDLFRDLHTVKGSSAMVGLAPINRLAHAAEDLVGQLRDGARAVDGAVVDALLGALDGLRAMLGQARARAPVEVDPAPVVRRLRDPSAPGTASAPSAPGPDVSAVRPIAGDGRGAAVAAAAARQTIRVDFDKLDRLMNLVGELVLGRDGLRSAIGALSSVTGELSIDRVLARKLGGGGRVLAGGAAPARGAVQHLSEELNRIERVLTDIHWDLDHSTGRLDGISSELREQVMRLRMVPIGGVFRKHVRTVRDLGVSLGKRVRLELSGEETELDKLLVEALDDPLMHLVRNAVDHGVERPDQRLAAGKPAEGVIRIGASHRGNQVTIRIADDGRGMDPDKLRARARERGIASDVELETMDDRGALELIFRPGFSTAATVSEVSGRGVGMDVVRQTIVHRLKGSVEIESGPGRGSAFTLKLPLTLAIMQVLLARASGEVYAIPLDSVVRTIVVSHRDVHRVGDRETLDIRGRHVPLVRLVDVLELDAVEASEDDQLCVVLTEQGGDLYGLACDHLLGKREIVIKSLGELLSAVPCAAGATLLGDRCALILDVAAIVQRALRRPTAAAERRAPEAEAREAPAAAAHILLVEDSDIAREALRRLYADAGFQVTAAIDGVAGLELARARRFDLVSTDVMMPRMDGYELTRALRALPEYRDVPIVMVTSRGERIDRVRGFDAGVDEYITKPHDRQLLLRAVKKLLGHGKEPT